MANTAGTLATCVSTPSPHLRLVTATFVLVILEVTYVRTYVRVLFYFAYLIVFIKGGIKELWNSSSQSISVGVLADNSPKLALLY